MSVSLVTRQRAQQQAAMRAEIVDAAFAEFSERGYHQTGIADIAKRLGIGHGTFYRYFRNKRDILEHVVDSLVARLEAALSAENAPDVPTTLDEYRRQAERIGDAIGEIFAADPRAARMLLFESTSIDPELTDRVLGMFDLAGETAAEYLRNGVRRGYMRADLDIANTADAITGMVVAAVIRALRSGPEADARRSSQEAIVRLLMEGAMADGQGPAGKRPNSRRSAERAAK
jgi:AcrR family transcriptional regulator